MLTRKELRKIFSKQGEIITNKMIKLYYKKSYREDLLIKLNVILQQQIRLIADIDYCEMMEDIKNSVVLLEVENEILNKKLKNKNKEINKFKKIIKKKSERNLRWNIK